MKIFNDKTIWFVTGSQHLYGPKILEEVAKDSQGIVDGLNKVKQLSVPLLNKGTVVSPEDIASVCQQANNDPFCIGLVLWMHTFSPAKMWISGLMQLNKPFMHLHTQFNAALPWENIDMNFMNLNQSAHGGREFGFIGARLGIERKIVVGHWKDKEVHKQLDDWFRAAIGVDAGRHLRVARFGDNMRQVAVTEGNKVSAQIQFGYEVHAFGLGDLTVKVDAVTQAQVEEQLKIYQKEYHVEPTLLSDPKKRAILENEARLELGLYAFLTEGGFGAFTNTFENLTGLTGLPGLATQRLMQLGFGYGGEGDWKTAAMVHIMKVMAKGLPGGTSFMEDYTYNFSTNALEKDQVLGAHMLEVCPTIAAEKPTLEIHQHTIGVTCDVARLRFTGATGDAIVVSPIDLGNRFRIILNEVTSVKPPKKLSKLPVACTLFEPKPDLKTSATAWITAGGAHHNAYSLAVTTEMIADYAELLGCELVIIDQETQIRQFKNELRQNSIYYRLQQGV